MTKQEIMDLIQWGDEAALTWYSTVTEKPIRTPAQASLMGSLVGTDISTTGPYQAPIAIGSGILIIGMILIAVWAMRR